MKSSRAIHLGIIIYLVFMLFILPKDVKASRTIPDDNLSMPVLVQLKNGGAASGFYMNTDTTTYFVTARHVLFNKITDETNKVIQYALITKSAELLSYPRDPNENARIVLDLDLEVLNNAGEIKFHKVQDIAIVRVGIATKDESGQNIVKFINGVTLKEKAKSGLLGVAVSNVKKYIDVLAANDVYIFGYPSSIGIKDIPQIEYEKPLLRKGIVAGKNDQNKTIILDCPTYYGNSGGPVVEVEQVDLSHYNFKVIGIISEFVPFSETWLNTTQRYYNITLSNSGYSVAVSMDTVLELIEK